MLFRSRVWQRLGGKAGECGAEPETVIANESEIETEIETESESEIETEPETELEPETEAKIVTTCFFLPGEIFSIYNSV